MNLPYYFGYGSNLDRQDWQRFCAQHGCPADALRPVGPAWLPDHELVFHYFSTGRGGGALDIRPAIGKAASGWLYAPTDQGWATLDRKENVGTAYGRIACTVIDAAGGEVAAETYQVLPHRTAGFTPPTEEYLAICRRGRSALGVDVAALDAAADDRTTPGHDSLFVYGTLMRGEMRFHYIRKAEPASILLASTAGRLHDHGEYPGMSLPGEGRVHGELVRIKGMVNVLPILDDVERFAGFGRGDNLYRRSLVAVDIGAGATPVLAWTYVMQRADGSAPIESGDWRRHRGLRQNAVDAIVRSHLARAPNVNLPLALGVASAADIVHALDAGALSEHRLAQASGCWVATGE
jgi:gamma-glutamylcyclotransferase (GGCT)/AIG2-like uncharacterized protein YtfP